MLGITWIFLLDVTPTNLFAVAVHAAATKVSAWGMAMGLYAIIIGTKPVPFAKTIPPIPIPSTPTRSLRMVDLFGLTIISLSY